MQKPPCRSLANIELGSGVMAKGYSHKHAENSVRSQKLAGRIGLKITLTNKPYLIQSKDGCSSDPGGITMIEMGW